MDRIPFADDEPSVLAAIQRSLRPKYDIHVAGFAEEGLLRIESQGPFPVVVSDYQMPGSDGIAFLAQVSKISPDSVRMMLTGYAQLETSIRAVNEGKVFRFLSKPCPMSVLEDALADGLCQYNLVQTEREYYALKKWNDSLGGLIQAFVRLIESKDPYTAGHQLRVSQLSAAIAKGLNYPSEAVEQIRMTAMLHDIGKTYIPVEFLNKPGFLNPSEWGIVKMHSQIGHDILNPIGFPFPIHEIVLQHHERIDGSDYPVGLRESEMRMEAKIIAVADVVEAIGHHRPYRPAKGFEEAIRELQVNQVIKYDSKVSDVAQMLLVNEGFQFQ